MCEQNSRAESRWDPSMYLSAWNDGWLPVGCRNANSLQLDREKSSLCVCVCVFASNSRKLYTYIRSHDDLNICEFLCSPGVVLSQLKTEDETCGDFMDSARTAGTGRWKRIQHQHILFFWRFASQTCCQHCLLTSCSSMEEFHMCK